MADETTTGQYEPQSRLHEAIASFEQARDAGQEPKPQAWLDRYPEVASQLADFFADHEHLQRLAGPLRPDASRVALAPGGEPETFPEVPGYQVLEVIGWGGMGVVYKARQLSADRIVALKVIRPDRLEGLSPEERRKAIERFITEAQAAAKLEHENIVHVYEVGEVRGRPFYSMRYVVGTSLHDLIQRGPLEARRAAGYLEKVARAVHEAHRHGILHRDLKPHNILLEANADRPLVADFGLAKLLQGGRDVTGSGDVMGTPPYMSPEQAQGSSQLTVATDVYGLGATLYALLTGRPPFRGETPVETLGKVIEEEPVAPRQVRPTVPRDLETICLKCLEKEPRKRYASAEELADRLRLFVEGKPIPDRPITNAERLWRWCRRNPILAATGCAAGAALFAVFVLSISFAIHATHAAENEIQAAADLRTEHAKTVAALVDATTERRKAEDGLVDLEVAQGVRLIDQGDLLGSLPWFVKALEDEKGGREEIQRMRLGAVWEQCPRLLQFWLHNAPVAHAEFSSDGRRVVTASHDKTARVWDAQSGQPVTPPLKHNAEVWHAAFSPDGRRVVTASDDGSARVWDAQSGQPVTAPLNHNLAVRHAAFSPDGRRVVTASHDGSARVWDTQSGQPVTAPLKHNTTGSGTPGTVWRATFSPDGLQVVTASADQTARVWNAQSGQPVTVPLKHNGGVRHAAFSPDGRRVITASEDQTARVWDAQSGQPVTVPLKHNREVWHAAFSLDGQQAVTASDDGTARVWDTQSGQPVTAPLKHNNTVCHAAFSPDGRRVATASWDWTALVWDVRSGQPVTMPLKHKAGVWHAAFSAKGHWLVTASWDGTARVWDAQSSQPVTVPLKHSARLWHAAFSADGRWVVTASDDQTARVWDARSGHPVTPPLKHNGKVLDAAFSRDGRRVVTVSSDGARVWDAQSGQPVSAPLHNDQVVHAGFSPDGQWVITGGLDETARVWDVISGQPVTPPLKHNSDIYHTAFSPDGRLVVTASGDGTARVWDARSGQLVTPPLKHNGVVLHAAFSPDARQVVTASDDQTARVWDAQNGQPVTAPLKHEDRVFHATFSPDGRRVVTASWDETARVWDAQSGQPVTVPLKHSGRVWHAAFSADGRRVVTVSDRVRVRGDAESEDQTARVWDAQSGQPVTLPLKHNGGVRHAAFSPDGRRVVTVSADGTARILELAADQRPVDECRLLAQMVTGQRMDASGGFAPLEPKALNEIWQTLRAKYPRDFAVSAVERPRETLLKEDTKK